MRETERSDNTPGEHRNPEELQHAADAIRADLDRTLDALERKLSPRGMANRSLDSFRRNGTDLLQKAAKHPIPVLLASASLLWFASSQRKRSATMEKSRGREQGRSKPWFSASAKLRPAAAVETARKTTRETRLHLGRMIRERPVLCGTVAAALGAAVSAAVPATHYERDAVLRARDSAGPILQRTAQVLRRFSSLRK